MSLHTHTNPRSVAEAPYHLYTLKPTGDHPSSSLLFLYPHHVFQTITGVENLQRVSLRIIPIQTPNQPALGKCHNLITETPYGRLLDFFSFISPECTKLPGSPPHLTTSNVFDWEMWAMFEEAVFICCFRPAAH